MCILIFGVKNISEMYKSFLDISVEPPSKIQTSERPFLVAVDLTATAARRQAVIWMACYCLENITAYKCWYKKTPQPPHLSLYCTTINIQEDLSAIKSVFQ